MPNGEEEPMNISGAGGQQTQNPTNQFGQHIQNPLNQNPMGEHSRTQQIAIDIDTLSRQIASNMQRQNNLNFNQTLENPQYPVHANYRDFTRYLPEFDGTPKTCSLNTFINYCESAREYAPTIGERPVVSLLKSKCKGIACESLESFTITTIDELINILRNRFITSRPLFAWLEELHTFEQQNKETLLGFYSRVNLHLTQTQQAIDLSKVQNPQGAKDWARDMAIDQFRKGVNPAYSAHIPITVFPTLESIYQQTIEIEKMVGPTEQNNKNQSTCLPINSQSNKNKNTNDSTKQNQKTNSGKFCNFCKKTNHVTDDCYALAKQNKSQTTENKNNVSCNYCKKPGHVINDCRRRAFNNGRKAEANSNKQPGNESTTPRLGASTGQNQ